MVLRSGGWLTSRQRKVAHYKMLGPSE